MSIERIEGLVRAIEGLPDPAARASAGALVRALLDFHGEALDRLMEIVAAQGEAGYSIFDKFSGDQLVSSLLLLYGLHPVPLETRVLQALEKVKPYLASHGGDVELLGINEGVVRLRLHGSCKGCPSSAETLKLAIEAAIYEAAPDIASIEAEGALETSSPARFVQIENKPRSQVKRSSLVERIADAVLYEGYILYPYRPSAVKNQQRWNFGVVCPTAYELAQQGTESSTMQTECLIEVDPSTTIDVKVRFLHLLLRELGENVADCQLPRTWQEALPREVVVPQIKIGELESPHSVRFHFPASKTTESLDQASSGVILRTQHAIDGEIEITARRQSAIDDGHLVKLSVVIRNLTAFPEANDGSRDDALMRSFVSTHTILEAQRGSFVSLLDPPANYKAAASECITVGTYPVLVGDEGDRSCVLSSPIILYDYPQIASQSPGDLFDGTEIDEILTLRIMSLTDEEKREMRTADELARKLLERTESMSPEQLMNLHGVMKKV